MFVCGGFRTCWSVWVGVVKFVRNWRRLAGRHLEKAPRSKPPAPPPPPKPPPPLFEGPLFEPPFFACSLAMQARIASACVAVCRGRLVRVADSCTRDLHAATPFRR